ncbi:pentapeptide repeat-containing protein [Mycolicibacterium conceptionense]|uniref:pentapeptide repeat-containing protein n=1 Tax=Mycolicibacterium conceptionense TaxID=451644 RepID=UPI000A149D3B|nr:pentapeptide repeat-containing protein [Mycolicibacterium conceptionense]
MDAWLTQPLATLMAGSVVAIAAVITFASSALVRRQTESHFASQHELDRERSLRERYTEAATQLGSESPAIRLAGALSLVALADDWVGCDSNVSGQMTVDLLRGYLRVEPAGHPGPAEQEVRKTILLQTSRRANWYAQLSDAPTDGERGEVDSPYPNTPSQYFVRGVNRLRRARLDADIEREKARSAALLQEMFPQLGLWGQLHTNLNGAWLAGCNLRRIHIAGAHLVDATLSSANLESADLERVTLSGAKLVEARLCGVYARKAVLDHADLANANLRHATLTEVDLRHANLAGADLTGALLGGADLEGANLTGASLGRHDPAQLAERGAILDDPGWQGCCNCFG